MANGSQRATSSWKKSAEYLLGRPEPRTDSPSKLTQPRLERGCFMSDDCMLGSSTKPEIRFVKVSEFAGPHESSDMMRLINRRARSTWSTIQTTRKGKP